MNHKSISQKLEEVRKRMLKEFEDCAVMTLDMKGTVVSWNEAAVAVKGYSHEEIIGQNFSLFYLPDDRQKNLPEKFLQIAMAEGYALYAGRRVRKDGSTFYGIMFLTTLYNIQKTPIGFAKFTRELLPDEA